ncbi:Toxin-antitoxin system, antitoxin component family protein [Nostocoides australiense Ben110]|uniref:Toxin-antitoxin system, antitoxin component family protein n=1 Tax=Nostocoides australiense Ben110 TaxID=1193182 RepID=W6K1W1_9MICO|nr:HepT-like ribonuclease domain-containing protein [Tetrasphaera australiensis]CCH75071.1 Toxin-antitoxin system, antitoxin component family protein [Tetrasphaera australiensis Ben110]
MSRSTEELLRDALTHFDPAIGYAHAGALDQLAIDAVWLRLASGIEVLARLEPSVRESLFGQDWTLMWGMRNRIAHGYLLVDQGTVRETVERDLPEVVGALRRALAID